MVALGEEKNDKGNCKKKPRRVDIPQRQRFIGSIDPGNAATRRASSGNRHHKNLKSGSLSAYPVKRGFTTPPLRFSCNARRSQKLKRAPAGPLAGPTKVTSSQATLGGDGHDSFRHSSVWQASSLTSVSLPEKNCPPTESTVTKSTRRNHRHHQAEDLSRAPPRMKTIFEPTLGYKYPTVASGATPIESAGRAPDKIVLQRSRRSLLALEERRPESSSSSDANNLRAYARMQATAHSLGGYSHWERWSRTKDIVVSAKEMKSKSLRLNT